MKQIKLMMLTSCQACSRSAKQASLLCTRSIAALAAILLLAACTEQTDNPVQPSEPEVARARITETIRYEKEKTTAYNFEYPSVDPFGNPCTLSGTITIGDEVTTAEPARGMVLYNHFTVYRADQCPSKGDLAVQKMITGSGLITVSADYYGFGVTEGKQQAYCISAVNAQASVDALLSARELLKGMGYSWDDILFNAGYSQGGQTSMAVLKLVTEKYPDIRFTYTFAGGGSYDIPETYRQFIQSGETAMPSTVISVLLAYDEYFQLGIPRSDIFREPTLSHIDEWVLSKKYTREEIDEKVGSGAISVFATDDLLNLESDLSKRYMTALDQDNLSKGWKVREGEKIILIHNKADGAVPVANTEAMYNFFVEQGLNVSRTKADNPDIYVRIENWGALSAKMPAHETGALFFVSEAVVKVCEILGIKQWFTITPQMLEGM